MVAAVVLIRLLSVKNTGSEREIKILSIPVKSENIQTRFNPLLFLEKV